MVSRVKLLAELDIAERRVPVAAFVRDTFVLPARDPRTGIRVDFIFATTAYERQAIARAERVELLGTPVPFATAEDLIVHKLFAGRPHDEEDAPPVPAGAIAGECRTFLRFLIG